MVRSASASCARSSKGPRLNFEPKKSSAIAGAAHDPRPEAPCHWPGQLPPHIKPAYADVALITNESHLEDLEVDDDLLIICCDWLLWHRLLDEGRHAVFYELGILEWPETDTLNTDLFNHANDWILDMPGDDPSLFHGVSLARLFGAEMTMAMMNYHRINRALRTLFRRFQPKRVHFHDFRYDINHLSTEMRRNLVREIAEDCGAAFIDRSRHDGDDDGARTIAVYRHETRGRLKRVLAAMYAATLAAASRLRRLLEPRRPRVLVLANTNIASCLIMGFAKGDVNPVFLARTVPKDVRHVWHCLREGVLLSNIPTPRLGGADQAKVAEIIAELRRRTSHAEDPARRFAHAYVRENILSGDTMLKAAADVRAAERMLDRLRPTRIVADSARSRRHLTFLELAKRRGISVDYYWHSPMTPQNIKIGALGGDPRQPVFVTRCLSWGRTNEIWLSKVQATQPVARVGSPLRDRYAHRHDVPSAAPKLTNAERKVLILQYGFNVLDLAGVNANMYGTFVNMVRLLRRQGFTDIRLKMHPGPGRWKKVYFERISETFGLNCPVLMTEPFDECLAWADLVIGPSHTGALFETLAAGKPYHAILLPPHTTFDMSYFQGFPISGSLEDLPAALEQDVAVAGRKVLDDLYSIDAIPNPSAYFWDVLNQDADCGVAQGESLET